MTDISDKNNWYAMSDDRILKQIGEFVKHYRMERNITQSALAKDAGISRSTLSLLEKGEAVSTSTLIQVLRVLEQLQIVDEFVIPAQQQSPLQLAKELKAKRKRVSSIKKKDEKTDDIDW